MKRWAPLLFLVFALLILPARAVAQATAEEGEGFIFRADGDVTVGAGEVMGTVIVADGNATVLGEVTDTLWVISGDAVVEGTVGGDVVVIDGTLSLAQGSTVKNVSIFSGTLDRADGATVTGDISEQEDFVSFGWGAAVFTMLMWLGVTLALIVAAILFAIYGGRQLRAAGDTLQGQLGMSVLTALALWVGLPILAVLAFVTVIGIPLGMAIFMVVLPALWFLGYLVAGAKLGGWIMRTVRSSEQPAGGWLWAAIGVLVLQLVGLIPGLGPVVAVIAGIVGSGALVYWLVGHPRPRQAATTQPHPQPIS